MGVMAQTSTCRQTIEDGPHNYYLIPPSFGAHSRHLTRHTMPSAHILVTRFAWLFLGDARLFRQPLSFIIFRFFTKKEIRLEYLTTTGS